MAEIEGRGTVNVDATLRLDEPEMEALSAVASYGDDTWIKVLYQHMAYVKPHERGLRTFFKAIRTM